MATAATYNLGQTGASTSVSSLAVAPGKITKVAGVNTAGNYGVGTVVAAASEQQLTTTNPTTVLNFQAPAAGLYEVRVYFRVTGAATNVGITVNYTSPTGAQTTTLVPSQGYAVGDYAGQAAMIVTTANASISVTATAGTANQVYVSAVLVGY